MFDVDLPTWLAFLGVSVGGAPAWQWLWLLLAVPVAYAFGRLVSALLGASARRLAARTRADWDDTAVRLFVAPVRFGLFAALLRLAYELPRLVPGPRLVATFAGRLLLAFGAAFFAWKLVDLVQWAIERRTQDAGVDPHSVRALRTRAQVIGRVLRVVVVVVGVGLALVQFDVVRSLGLSVLASAGAASLVLGLAAQRSLGSVFAGLQLSLTQPVRVGDAVVIEGEWGTVEEIGLTYALVQLWDERRMVVPLTTFLDRPFVNWTRKPGDLVGIVFLWVDFTADVEAIRAEMMRFLEGHPAWSRRHARCVVSDCTDRAVQLRLTASAEVGQLFDLRFALREHMLRWLREQHGGSWLPRTRVSEGRPGASG
ncbi:MAG: mechanosensitive ion channel family protein [Myxococcota bacterium]|nr:mechanosensitive ion channel family protein [Myxococcota bacterium]MDW8361307.1 mechanosensitive ion channel [Myxococcales bacterium]